MGLVRRVLSRTALVGGWAAAVGMSTAALIRLLRSESQPQLIGIQGIGMWLLLPAYPLAIAAAMTRQKSLAAVAVVLAIGNVVWVSEAYESGQQRTAASGSLTPPSRVGCWSRSERPPCGELQKENSRRRSACRPARACDRGW